MLINKENFLQILDSVSAGISKNGSEQGKCFVFKNKKVMTFNGECFVRRNIPLEIAGAVEASPLIGILKKIKETEIDVNVEENKLVIKVIEKRKEKEVTKKKSWISFNSNITLPIEIVDKPSEWNLLDENFEEAIDIVGECSSKSKSDEEWLMTCINIHPKWIESGDYYQACRYRIENKVPVSILVKHSAIKGIKQLGMSEISVTEGWLHFKNQHGVFYSCRRHSGEYPSLGKHFKFEGQQIILPRDLSDAIVGAEEFSSLEDSNLISVNIKPNRIKIQGDSEIGGYYEIKKIKYDGPEILFYISPKILTNLSSKFSEGVVSETKLKFVADSYKVVCYLRRQKK